MYGWGFLNPKGGFYAEYVALSEDEVSGIPVNLSLEAAGVLAVDGLTALAGLDKLVLGRDRTLMILGASGGVGHLALQLAKRLEVRVFAVASGNDGVELVRHLGADNAVDGRSSTAATKARAFAPNGFDAALVLARGGLEKLLGLRPAGRAHRVSERRRTGGAAAPEHRVRRLPRSGGRSNTRRTRRQWSLRSRHKPRVSAGGNKPGPARRETAPPR